MRGISKGQVDLVLQSKNKAITLVIASVWLAALEMLAILAFISIGDSLLSTDAAPGVAKSVTSWIIPGNDAPVLFDLSILFLVLVGIALPIQLWIRYFAIQWMTQTTAAIHTQVVDSILWRPLSRKKGPPDEVGRMMHDAMTAPILAGRAIDHIANAIWTAVFAVGVLVGMALISPYLLGMALVLMAVIVLVLIIPSRSIVERLHLARNAEQIVGSALASGAVRNLRDIKAVSGEDVWSSDFRDRIERSNRHYKWAEWLSTSPSYLIRSSGQLIFGIGGAVAATVLSTDEIQTQIATFISFGYGMFRIYPVINMFGRAWIGLGQTTPYLDSALTAIGRERDSLRDGAVELNSAIDVIEFDHVGFSYDERIPVFVDASCKIKLSEVTLVQGGTGEGKSTFLDLVMKFEVPDSGHVRVDGQDLRDVDRDSWLNMIGLVSQEVVLFPGSIIENIRAWNPDVADDVIESACRDAEIFNFIKNSPEGFETHVGDHGESISGGQRQRLALARALIRQPKLLILDEATSALDSTTEQKILDNLRRREGIDAILMVSHRPHMVQMADHVLKIGSNKIS